MKRYYTTFEVCKELKISYQTIYNWELYYGTLHSGKSRERKRGCTRLYTLKDLEKIRKIIALKETGLYTKKGIKHYLS